MSKVRVHHFSVSLDGFGAGPDQGLNDPIGVGGTRLHEWLFATKYFADRFGTGGGGTGLDNEMIARAEHNVGATIMGRNMFGPVRGDWPDLDWTGWWGSEPPYHHPVFVLTHHPRPSIPMQGGTVFHFVDDGIESALEQALAAADGQDVQVGGGVSTVKQYLRAGLIDEMELALVPILLGTGERLLDGESTLGYECSGFVASPAVIHARFVRTVAPQP